MNDLRERILRAHGGDAGWRRLRRLSARVSMGGSLFLAHMQPRPLRDAEVVLEPQRFRMSVTPFTGDGRTGVFEPRRVWIHSDDGTVIGERGAPGSVTRSLRHWMVWDGLDLLYVLGLCTWQALLLPLMLCRSGVAVEPVGTCEGDDGRLECLDVHLSSDLPVPATHQRWYADATGCLRRADYAPLAWGRMVRVGQLLDAHESVDGVLLASHQTVYPCWPRSQLMRTTRVSWLTAEDVVLDHGE
ncbi:hypothetical protein [Arhodomonas sp. AD133]|uniref:hypothetical protein n=1 Tax=Arhodomonas sp. AD133 TaxID=3415009 RepID=UPI003EBABD40